MRGHLVEVTRRVVTGATSSDVFYLMVPDGESPYAPRTAPLLHIRSRPIDAGCTPPPRGEDGERVLRDARIMHTRQGAVLRLSHDACSDVRQLTQRLAGVGSMECYTMPVKVGPPGRPASSFTVLVGTAAGWIARIFWHAAAQLLSRCGPAASRAGDALTRQCNRHSCVSAIAARPVAQLRALGRDTEVHALLAGALRT